MIEGLVEKLLKQQVNNGVIESSQEAVYRYGYIVLIEMTINVVLSLLVGVCSGKLTLVLLFSIMFIPLRSYCGGWHAPKDWMCMLFSLGTLLLVVYEEWFPTTFWKVAFLESVSLVVIFLMAPVDSRTKELEKEERKKFRIIARVILILEVAIAMVSLYFQCEVLIWAIIAAHFFQCISLLIIKVEKNQKKKFV